MDVGRINGGRWGDAYPLGIDLVRRAHSMSDVVHANDVRIDNPKWVELLVPNDVVLLPVWGRSRVIDEPHYLPGSNNTIVVLNIWTGRKNKRLLCDKHMPFQFLGFNVEL